MIRFFFVLAAVFILSFTFSPDAIAARGIDVEGPEKRVALVIGNAKYSHIPKLRNPENDANDVVDILEQLGFQVISAINQSRDELGDSLDRFDDLSQGADVALLYYAGHGIAYKGQNFMIPVDARLKSKNKVRQETFSLNDMVGDMERNAKMTLVFLDACRNNPLPDALKRRLRQTRSAANGGLTQMKTGDNSNTLIVFAAEAGKVAQDGVGRNSPFTKAFLKHVASTGTEIEVMLKDVTRDVIRETHKKQRPQRVSSLTAKFYFSGSPEERPTLLDAHQGRGRLSNNQYCSMQYQKALSRSNRRSALNQFITRCPTHRKVKSAELLVEELADAENCEKCLKDKSIRSCQYYKTAHPNGLCISQANRILTAKLDMEDHFLKTRELIQREKRVARRRAREQKTQKLAALEQRQIDNLRAENERETETLRRKQRERRRLEREIERKRRLASRTPSRPAVPPRTFRPAAQTVNGCLSNGKLRSYLRNRTIFGKVSSSGKVWRAYFPAGERAVYQFSDGIIKDAEWRISGSTVFISFDGKKFHPKQVCTRNGTIYWKNADTGVSSSTIVALKSGNNISQGDFSNDEFVRPARTRRPSRPQISSKAFTLYANYDLSGGAYRSIRRISQGSCRSKCRSDSNCIAYTYDKWNKMCHLKSSGGTLVFLPKTNTGYMQGRQQPGYSSRSISIKKYRGELFPGHTYRTIQGTNYNSCERACMGDSNCVAFSYAKRYRKCGLKNAAAEYHGDRHVDSGVKVQ